MLILLGFFFYIYFLVFSVLMVKLILVYLFGFDDNCPKNNLFIISSIIALFLVASQDRPIKKTSLQPVYN